MADKKMVFSTVAQASNDILRDASERNARLDQRQGELAPIARDTANWESDSGEAYRGYQQQWDEAATELSNVLHIIGQGVGTAHANAVATEQANTSMWQV